VKWIVSQFLLPRFLFLKFIHSCVFYSCSLSASSAHPCSAAFDTRRQLPLNAISTIDWSAVPFIMFVDF